MFFEAEWIVINHFRRLPPLAAASRRLLLPPAASKFPLPGHYPCFYTRPRYQVPEGSILLSYSNSSITEEEEEEKGEKAEEVEEEEEKEEEE